jgi:hypothetical protein
MCLGECGLRIVYVLFFHGTYSPIDLINHCIAANVCENWLSHCGTVVVLLWDLTSVRLV